MSLVQSTKGRTSWEISKFTAFLTSPEGFISRPALLHIIPNSAINLFHSIFSLPEQVASLVIIATLLPIHSILSPLEAPYLAWLYGISCRHPVDKTPGEVKNAVKGEKNTVWETQLRGDLNLI